MSTTTLQTLRQHCNELATDHTKYVIFHCADKQGNILFRKYEPNTASKDQETQNEMYLVRKQKTMTQKRRYNEAYYTLINTMR